ncbi:hypothetical protein BHE74_00055812 [Ensete ventricosum]|nr:hypothetical protein BHE74_00055812 [Ensete ventricosum]
MHNHRSQPSSLPHSRCHPSSTIAAPSHCHPLIYRRPAIGSATLLAAAFLSSVCRCLASSSRPSPLPCSPPQSLPPTTLLHQQRHQPQPSPPANHSLNPTPSPLPHINRDHSNRPLHPLQPHSTTYGCCHLMHSPLPQYFHGITGCCLMLPLQPPQLPFASDSQPQQQPSHFLYRQLM